MADQSVFRLTAVGPASLYKAVESDSVQLDHGVNTLLARHQDVTPHAEFVQAIVSPLEWSERYVSYAAVAKVSDLGAFWQELDDITGLLGTGGVSVVADALVIPQQVSCRQEDTARTSLRGVWLAEPTVGTTTKTPATADDAFIIGPSTFNNVALKHILSQSLNFGYTIGYNTGMSGNVRPDKWWIKSFEPVISIDTHDLDIVKAYIKAPVKIASNCCVLKFQNQAGTGYGYTAAAGSVLGSIKGDVGTLRIQILKPATGTTLAGATYI